MKIILIGPVLPDAKVGGVSTHCARLRDRLQSAGVEHEVINVGDGLARALMRLVCCLVRHTGDHSVIFHFQTSASNYPFLLVSPLLAVARAKSIVSFHSGALPEQLKRTRRLRWGFVVCRRVATRIVLMNEGQVLDLEKSFAQVSSQCTVIHSFIFPAWIPTEEDSSPRDVFVITAMAAWLDHYRLEDVLAATAKWMAKRKPGAVQIRFGIALSRVDEAYRESVKNLAIKMMDQCPNLTVKFHEDVRDPLKFIARSDVMVRSSRVDSFGLCVAEALLVGRPAVATDVCRRAEGALLYRPGDTDALAVHLEEIFQRKAGGGVFPVKLDESADAFPLLMQLYRSL